ncbi:MAG: hypothetical protein ACE5HE_09000 [Phycisphaerae bacterium]
MRDDLRTGDDEELKRVGRETEDGHAPAGAAWSDVGDERAGEPIGDIYEALGGVETTQPPAKEHRPPPPEGAAGGEEPEDTTSRLLREKRRRSKREQDGD